ncbi:MAG: acyltransferase [Hymenobacter sp.]|nr:MAG: acyltransferase [Hymenobacter sp.]
MTSTTSIQKPQLDSLVLLRGLAAIMVCFYHFTYTLPAGYVAKFFHEYGLYGVEIFFIISGFVIPLSLFNSKYQLQDYGKFLYKRLLRLHPPYLAALLLTLITIFFSYRVRHVPFPETAASILGYVFYQGHPADNPVFWTLKVEAEYYLFIGLFYAALCRAPKLTLYVLMPFLLVLGQTGANDVVRLLEFLLFFMIGTVGFLLYVNKGNRSENILIISALLIAVAFVYNVGLAFLCCATIVLIVGYQVRLSGLPELIGRMSYSIYLIHFVIGVKFINFLQHRMPLACRPFLFTAALLVSIGAGWIFYKLVEERFEHLSRRIRYGTPSRTHHSIMTASQAS